MVLHGLMDTNFGLLVFVICKMRLKPWNKITLNADEMEISSGLIKLVQKDGEKMRN